MINTILPLTYTRINLEAVRQNFLAVQALADQQTQSDVVDHVDIIPVIKSDAYGHGMIPAASVLDELGAKYFAVSNLQEAIALRDQGFMQNILLLESTLATQASLMVQYQLTPTLCTKELANALSDSAINQEKKVDVHIKVDTGMSRFGIPIKEGDEFIKYVLGLPGVNIKGVYTHFPMADSNNLFTIAQTKKIVELLDLLKSQCVDIPCIHASNSMGLLGYSNHVFNLARIGLILYGMYPREDFVDQLNLTPAMSVHSQVVFIKPVAKGEGISYGHSYVAENDMTIAVLPIGYADGYFRHLSNKSHVLIHEQKCPVVGRVTMDQIMVDITHVDNVSITDAAVILGKQGEQEITAEDLAKWADTIPYEITCSLGARLPRIY